MNAIDRMIENGPGYYTRGDTSEDALILEARWALASRYGWTGLSNLCFDALNPDARYHPHITIAYALAYLDSYAIEIAARSEARSVRGGT